MCESHLRVGLVITAVLAHAAGQVLAGKTAVDQRFKVLLAHRLRPASTCTRQLAACEAIRPDRCSLARPLLISIARYCWLIGLGLPTQADVSAKGLQDPAATKQQQRLAAHRHSLQATQAAARPAGHAHQGHESSCS